MSRIGRVVAVLTGALVLSCSGIAPATAAEPDGSDDEQGPPQEAIEVPYLGEASIAPAAPWTVASCPEAPPGLVVACAPDRITLTAEGYDPAWGEHDLAVGLAGPVGALEVRYRVLLAPPEPPAAESLAWSIPVASGSQVLIPVAALAATCTRCTPGVARLEVGVVEPAAAGSALATGTHVAVRSTPGFAGEAVVPVRIVDDAGQPAQLEILLRVGPLPGEPFGGMHVLLPVGEEGDAQIDLAALTWPAPSPDAAFSCSSALLGEVSCADGVATYTAPLPRDGEAAPPVPALDQFAVRVVGPGGRIAAASVTLVPADAAARAGLPAEGVLAPIAGAAGVELLVGIPLPPDEGDVAPESLFTDLARVQRTRGLAG